MGANESQLKEQDHELITASTTTSTATSDQSINSELAASLPTTPMQSPLQQPLPQQAVQPHIPSHPHQIQLSDTNEVHLEHQLAQAQGELNEIRRRTLHRRMINDKRKERELKRGTRRSKSKTKEQTTEKPPTAAASSSQTSADSVVSASSQTQSNSIVPTSSVVPSCATTTNAASSISPNPLPPPPPPVVKTTPSEATLAYLIQSVQSNSRHQHTDVITKQIELLKEKMDDFRREKEREGKKEEKRREEEQRKQWLQTIGIDPNAVAATSPNVITSGVTDMNESPATKKAKRHGHESSRPYIPTPNPFFSSASSPTSQFQQIRDTIARDEVYCYPDDEDDDDDEMQCPPFIQQEQDADRDEHGHINYDAIYARMSDIIQQQNTDCDADMTGESVCNAPAMMLSSNTPPPPPPSLATLSPSISDYENPGPSASPPSTTTSTSLLATRTEVSRSILDLCLSGRGFISLEERYLSGKVTLDQMRYQLTILHDALEPQHERELVEQFERFKLKEKEEEEGEKEDRSECTTMIRSDSIIHRTLLSLPSYNDSFTPDVAVDDDPDGVARVRSHIFIDPASDTSCQQQQTRLKRKKSHQGSDSDMIVSAAPSTVDSAASSASTTPTSALYVASSVVSSSSRLPSRPSSFSADPPSLTSSSSPTNVDPSSTICRMTYVNQAYERLFGDTQSDLKSRGRGDLSLRRDHYHAALRIKQRWWSEKAIDSMMYQVRARKDGTFVYCLVHYRISFLHGKLKQAVMSFMPLPEDDEHPMPPFVEGVDLDEDTLLYGYKPPVTATTASNE